MSKFCTKCGRGLQEGEVCACHGAEQTTQSIPNYQNQMQGQEMYQGQQAGYMGQKQSLPSYDVNTFAIISLIMGIVGVCTEKGMAFGILAIVFSVISKKRLRNKDLLGGKFVKAGFILGIIAIVFHVIVVFLEIVGVLAWSSLLWM